jgi:hypothetical protein
LKKGALVATLGPVRASTLRFEQDSRANWSHYRRSKVSETEDGDFFNRLAHYRPHHAAGQLLVLESGTLTVLVGILWVVRSEASWRAMPQEYGKWETAYKQYRLWCTTGLWQRILAELAP